MVRVRVEAFDSETGQPIPNGIVKFWRDAEIRNGKLVAKKPRPDYIDATNADGVAELEVEPGDYVITFESQLWSPVMEEKRIDRPGVIKIETTKAFV